MHLFPKSKSYLLINEINKLNWNYFISSSYLVIVPKLLKVRYDNQILVFIAAGSEPVEIKFDLMAGQWHIEDKIICKPGKISLLFNK